MTTIPICKIEIHIFTRDSIGFKWFRFMVVLLPSLGDFNCMRTFKRHLARTRAGHRVSRSQSNRIWHHTQERSYGQIGRKGWKKLLEIIEILPWWIGCKKCVCAGGGGWETVDNMDWKTALCWKIFVFRFQSFTKKWAALISSAWTGMNSRKRCASASAPWGRIRNLLMWPLPVRMGPYRWIESSNQWCLVIGNLMVETAKIFCHPGLWGWVHTGGQRCKACQKSSNAGSSVIKEEKLALGFFELSLSL